MKLGIIGHPVEHSLSPNLHQFLLQKMGLTGSYELINLAPEALASTLPQLVQSGYHGVNVTIPHKAAVLSHAQFISPPAQLIGAANTLVFEGGQIQADNTDIDGFIKSLPSLWRTRLPQSHILILGGGGAARAVLAGLIQLKTRSISIATRKPAQGKQLVETGLRMGTYYQSNTKLNAVPWQWLQDLSAWHGLVQTTPVGMWPDLDQSPLNQKQLKSLPEGAWVYDLIYRPRPTALLKLAENSGYATQDGLAMLAYQGIEAFERWQSQGIPDSVSVELLAYLADSLN